MSEPTYLSELAQRIHRQAREKGFYDTPRRLPEKLALVHSEVSEAFEAWRDNPAAAPAWLQTIGNVPQGWAYELVDVMIVCLDILEDADLDVDYLMHTKLVYNDSRPRLHGRAI